MPRKLVTKIVTKGKKLKKAIRGTVKKCASYFFRGIITKTRGKALEGSGENIDLFGGIDNNICVPIINMKFLGTKDYTYNELFDGFDTLRVITFSTSLSFINEIIEKFLDVEIVLGCEGVNTSVEAVAGFQEKSIELIQELCKKYKNIEKLLIDEKLRFYMSTKQLSHAKLFLLSNKENGNTRVILGSANFSKQAFSGKQKEMRIVCDNDIDAYKYFSNDYEAYKNTQCEYFTKQMQQASKVNIIENMPMWSLCKKESVLVIENTNSSEGADDTNFIINLKQRAKEIKSAIPAGVIKKGSAIIDTKAVKTITQNIKKQNTIKTGEQTIENPAFIYDLNSCKVFLNNDKWDLSPKSEDVEKDCKMIVDFFNGFSRVVSGDGKSLQSDYYKFMVWFLCSPFMSLIRREAKLNNRKNISFPIYGLLAGNSNAGKTSFVNFLYSMTFGKKYCKLVSKEKFNKQDIYTLKNVIKGIPIYFDDIDSNNFTKSISSFIKDDDYDCDNMQYPAIYYDLEP